MLLVLYVVGGAYLFYQRESEFEMEMKNEMMENHREAFINKVFWYLPILEKELKGILESPVGLMAEKII